MEFMEMTEQQQDRWYIKQAVLTVNRALETNDPTQFRMALLTVKDYLWYLEKSFEDVE